MNNFELAERIVNCISDSYADEESKENAEAELLDAFAFMPDDIVKTMLLRLCERIEDLTA